MDSYSKESPPKIIHDRLKRFPRKMDSLVKLLLVMLLQFTLVIHVFFFLYLINPGPVNKFGAYSQVLCNFKSTSIAIIIIIINLVLGNTFGIVW